MAAVLSTKVMDLMNTVFWLHLTIRKFPKVCITNFETLCVSKLLFGKFTLEIVWLEMLIDYHNEVLYRTNYLNLLNKQLIRATKTISNVSFSSNLYKLGYVVVFMRFPQLQKLD